MLSSLPLAGFSAKGRVVDDEGNGIAAVAVRVTGPGGALALSTDDDGWYHLGYARAAEYSAVASAERMRFTDIRKARIGPSGNVLPNIV